MPRRPNYNFERSQRDRAKAAKRDAKREARNARKSGEEPSEAAPPAPEGPQPTVVPGALRTPDGDTATTVTAFSISEIAGAYGDGGQGFKNLIQSE